MIKIKSQEEIDLITCIITRPQLSKLKSIIRRNDKNALVTDAFEIEDMTLESLDLPITLVLKDESSQEKYSSLISKAKDVRFVYLNNIREETNREIIFDAIKVKLLQDETDIYFIEEGMYANYIANFIFTLNKIAIIY